VPCGYAQDQTLRHNTHYSRIIQPIVLAFQFFATFAREHVAQIRDWSRMVGVLYNCRDDYELNPTTE
jgi:hypothetical protein